MRRRNFVEQITNEIRQPVRYIPAGLGTAIGAFYGDSVPERALFAAAGLAAGYFARELWLYARGRPWEAALTTAGVVLGYAAGNFLDENTRGAFIHLGWADGVGAVVGGAIGNRAGREIGRPRQ